jgi:uncharacterized protein (TIGR02996 family)
MTTAAIDGQGLLQAILVEPADDGLRLIYADWLEDEGQHARAEFIRCQVELQANRTPGHPMRPEASEENDRRQDWLASRVQDILKANGFFGMPPGSQAEWDRGFVESIRLPLDAWRQHGPALVRQHPIERVEASDVNVAADTSGERARLAVDWQNGNCRLELVEALSDMLLIRDRCGRLESRGQYSSVVPDPFHFALHDLIGVRQDRHRVPEKALRDPQQLRECGFRWVSDALLAWARAEATKRVPG